MKVITMYLPQFHRVPENDEWWGEGYTEWTAVRNATALYDGHIQPKQPFNNNYYNLLDVDTLRWQTELMKKYGVYAQCFYHYYFSEGRMLLEKPAELLLKNKDVDMNFCFSWANETWARSWSNIQFGNSWNTNVDHDYCQSGNGILIEQEYGDTDSWKKHYQYLRNFFLDSRYVKIDNMPLFVIHRPDTISCLNRMLECLNECAICDGFNGIAFIGTNCRNDLFKATLQLESNYSGAIRTTNFHSYEDTSYSIVANAYMSEEKTLLCGTPGYDDTPRRGNKGEILLGNTPRKFEEQMKLLFKLSEMRNNEYLFVNAWNEWGEGMYLEPDEENGHAYLEALKNASENYKEVSIQELIDATNKGQHIIIQSYRKKYEDILFQNRIMDALLKNRHSTCSWVENLRRMGVGNVAIYGIGRIGKHIVDELMNVGIDVKYIIDRVGTSYRSIPIFRIDMEKADADMVIVTVRDEKDKVRESLIKSGLKKTVSIIELLQ